MPIADEGSVDQTACKPGSVPPPCGDAAIIPLDRPSRDGSRDLPGALGPATALPCLAEASRGAGSLFGLAPGGACHAALVTKVPVRSYRTLSPLPFCAFSFEGQALRSLGEAGRSALCGAIPGVTPGGRYPPPCRRGARTFLDPLAETATAQPSDPRGPWSLAWLRSTLGAHQSRHGMATQCGHRALNIRRNFILTEFERALQALDR